MLTDQCAARHTAYEGLDVFDDHGDADLVVLLDDDRRPVGTAPREGVHGTDTPLHLAYSCWLVDSDGYFLLTRRALTKRSWPGVWTNSFCGHPRPGESLVDAVLRGGHTELGVEVTSITSLLPEFAYRATDVSGVVENEVCPVFVARTKGMLRPDPTEVAEYHWIHLDDLRAALDTAPWALSPWLRGQAAQFDPRGWARIRAFATTDDQGVVA